MLNKIIEKSLRSRLIVLMAALLLMIGGVYTSYKMDVDVFPDLNAPTVVVMTEAGGMAPEEVERLVTFPLETAVNGATDVRRVRSSSTMGFSILWVEFNWGTDIYRARQIVSEKITAASGQLPRGIGNPTLGPQSSILGELMFVSLTSDSTSLQDLRTLADWTIRPRLLATGGVAQVAVLGGDVREYQILLSPGKMKHYGITLGQVYDAVQGMNRNASGGVLYEYGSEYIIRGMLSTNDVEAMSRAVITTSGGGTPIMLGDVAEVKIGNRQPVMGTASERGKPAVILTVTKQPETSTIQLTEKLDEVLDDLGRNLPSDVNVSTDIYRQERFINSSINNVKTSLYEGAFFVVIVLFIFLMNVRTTFISLITIPLSLVISILILHLFGFTINTMSLGGMAIAIGSLVDDAIVDVENVYRRLRENGSLPANAQKPVIRIVYEASKEVRMPILNSTLIVVASFVPLFFLTGMEGRLLFPLGIAFISALCASTLVALTLTPVLCSYLLGNSRGSAVHGQEPYVVRNIRKVYLKMLAKNLVHKKTVLAVTGTALLITIIILTQTGRSFLPPFNEGSFTINVSTMPGISIEESDKIGHRAEEILMQIPEIKTIGRKTGRAELDEHALGVNVSELEVPYELKERSKAELMADIRRRLSVIPGINVEVGAPISHRIDHMLSGTRANIAIKLFGNDLGTMYSIGNTIKEEISSIEGLADINVEQLVERPQLQIEPKTDVMARYGITMPQFSQMVSVLLSGETVSQVYEGSRTFDLVLKAEDDSRSTREAIGSLIIDAAGTKIPLSHIADIRSTSGPSTINRENVARKLVISANVTERDLSGAVADIQDKIESSIQLPDDYHIEYGGQFESEKTASRTLLVTSLLAILVIFILLYNQFRNVTESLVILLNLPLALIGGVMVIWMGDGILSIPAIIGFISLFGIATRNGILLVSHYNDLRAQGLSLYDSVIKGSSDRLNPILMTALTSALALIPLVIGSDLPGNEIQSPMASVILGGLVSSTLLNGFIIPIMYIITNNKKDNTTTKTLQL